MKTMENPLSQMLRDSIADPNSPPGTIYFINPKYFPTGELDMDATAKASSMIFNVATESN